LCSGAHDQIIRTCINAGFNLRIVHEVTDVVTGLALVEAGLGLSLFPASIQDFETKSVVLREVYPPFPKVELALAYRSEDDSPLLRLFLSVAKDVFAGKPGKKTKSAFVFRKNDEGVPAVRAYIPNARS